MRMSRSERVEVSARMLIGAYLDARPTMILTYDPDAAEAIIAEARSMLARLAPNVCTPGVLDEMEAEWRREYIDAVRPSRGVAASATFMDEPLRERRGS